MAMHRHLLAQLEDNQRLSFCREQLWPESEDFYRALPNHFMCGTSGNPQWKMPPPSLFHGWGD